MLKRAVKVILGGAIGISAMVAAPANAFYAYIYYWPNGLYAGTIVYCDNGYQLIVDGYQTSNYVIEWHSGELPC